MKQEITIKPAANNNKTALRPGDVVYLSPNKNVLALVDGDWGLVVLKDSVMDFGTRYQKGSWERNLPTDEFHWELFDGEVTIKQTL